MAHRSTCSSPPTWTIPSSWRPPDSPNQARFINTRPERLLFGCRMIPNIVALSLALSPNMKEKGRYVEVSANDYPIIQQACVIMRSSKNKDTARQFLKLLKSPPLKELFQKYGFAIPNQ